MKISINVKGDPNSDYDTKYPIYHYWESFKDKFNVDSPTGLNNVF